MFYQLLQNLPVLLSQFGWLWLWFGVGGAFSFFGLVYTALFLWMLIHCIQYEPDRYFWFWVILIAHPIGTLAYFFARFLPTAGTTSPNFVRRFSSGGELRQLETAAIQIGNAYHFIQLGEKLFELGQYEKSYEAFQKAVDKEPENLQAIWGVVNSKVQLKQYGDLKPLLEKILATDPEYRFGDVSLAYGKVLCHEKNWTTARVHLEKHVLRWRHPESVYLLGSLYAEIGEFDMARQQLEGLIVDINGSPSAIARKQSPWKSRAQKLLNKLPAS